MFSGDSDASYRSFRHLASSIPSCTPDLRLSLSAFGILHPVFTSDTRLTLRGMFLSCPGLVLAFLSLSIHLYLDLTFASFRSFDSGRTLLEGSSLNGGILLHPCLLYSLGLSSRPSDGHIEAFGAFDIDPCRSRHLRLLRYFDILRYRASRFVLVFDISDFPSICFACFDTCSHDPDHLPRSLEHDPDCPCALAFGIL